MSNILFDTSLLAIDALVDQPGYSVADNATAQDVPVQPSPTPRHPDIPQADPDLFEIKSRIEQTPRMQAINQIDDHDSVVTTIPKRNARRKRKTARSTNEPVKFQAIGAKDPSRQKIKTCDLVGIEAFKSLDAVTPLPTPMLNIPPSSFQNGRLVVRKFRSSMLAGLKRTIILGAPGGGKSHTMRHFMYRLRKFYASVLVINPSETSNMMYSQCIPSLYVHNIFDTKICNRLINRQSMAVSTSVKNPTSLFILDDCTENIATLCSAGMRILWLRGRHLGNAIGTREMPQQLPVFHHGC